MDFEAYDYMVLIDESGDPAFNKLADGKGNGSDFLNLRAVLIAKKDYKSIDDCLNYIKIICSKRSEPIKFCSFFCCI